MKTKQQIKDKMGEEKEGKSFGFSAVEGKKWEQREPTREEVLEEMENYMEFAIEKAIDMRRISAERSIKKMKMWLWIIEEDAVLGELPRRYFHWYGLPALIKICEHFDWNWRAMIAKYREYINEGDCPNWYVYAYEIKESCGIDIGIWIKRDIYYKNSQ